MTSPLIVGPDLAELIADGDAPTLLDVRWELATGAQRDRYESGHIPGAAFIDLGRELSAPPGPGGRHPLPAPEDFGSAMRAAGVSDGRPVVVYDAANALAAARAWWLLRFHGHPDVRVLDGGLAAWVTFGGAVAWAPSPRRSRGTSPPVRARWRRSMPPPRLLWSAPGCCSMPARPSASAETWSRWIPSAATFPAPATCRWRGCSQEDGQFRDPEAVRREFEAAGVDGTAAIGAYCGSGITAAHTVLALELAGLDGALYPGSWSEWVTDPARPVATGP